MNYNGLTSEPVQAVRRVRQWAALLLAAGALFSASSGPIRRAGQLTVNPHCAVDLDRGVCECMVTLDGDGTEFPSHPPGKDDDFRLEPGGSRLYIQPRHGTLLAKPTSVESGLTGCMAAQYAKARMRVDGFPAGACICVRTNEGRYAELRVDEVIRASANRVLLSYKTWER
jgi:hypothetical protein